MSRGGFKVVNYWIWAFQAASRKPLNLNASVSNGSKVDFNRYVSSLKAKFGYEPEDIMRLIDFMYLHNPLQFDDLAQNANVKNLWSAATLFERWRKANAALIERVGIQAALVQTVPEGDLNAYLSSRIDEMRQAYGA